MIISSCEYYLLFSSCERYIGDGDWLYLKNLFLFHCRVVHSSQFDPAPRDETWHKSPRTPDYFL